MKKLANVFTKVLLALILLFVVVLSVPVNAEDVTTIKKSDGGTVKYRGTNIDVTIPTTYTEKDTEFRAVWVSALTGDISPFTSKTQYMKEIEGVFEVMEYYHMNTMVFHVRVMNDAFYKSKYNNWSRYYSTDPSWDALPWIVEECHRRGIEFHAWMNPYRVTTNTSANLSEVAKGFPGANPASNPANLLVGKNTIILNPGLPHVRKFLINTCMELIENYDIDGINFDDYFYDSGVDDSVTYTQYNPDKLSKADWRREQINTFIRELGQTMRAYNLESGRRVQLGIAPAGIWKSGNGEVTYDDNGTAISTGSNTSPGAYQCYGEYLYADTKKWVDEEWIDYLLPQTYWGLEHSGNGFADLVSWWDKVAKYKKTNMYAALATYQYANGGSGNSWATNPLEGYNEIMFGNQLDNIRGFCVYDFKSLRTSINDKKLMKDVETIWTKPKIMPEVRTLEAIPAGKVDSLNLSKTIAGYKLQFSQVEGAKYYVLYRSEGELTYSPSEVVRIVGNTGPDNLVEYIDEVDTSKNYTYGVKVQSHSLTLGEGTSKSTVGAPEGSLVALTSEEEILFADNIKAGETTKVRIPLFNYSFGGKINYAFSYSFDNKQWTDVKTFTIIGAHYGFEMSVPNGVKTIYYRLLANNRVAAYDSGVLEFSLSAQASPITNFIVISEGYAGADAKFIWNNFNAEKLNYTVQVSNNTFDWTDVVNVEANGLVNSTATATLPSESGIYYYRVVTTVDGVRSISEMYEVNTYKKIADFNSFRINGKPLEQYYVIHWDDEFSITWTGSSSSNNYVARYSKDGKNWLGITTLDKGCVLEKNGVSLTQTITFPDSICKVYIQIEANNSNGKAYSDIIVIYVNPDFFDYEIIGDYMIQERTKASELIKG